MAKVEKIEEAKSGKDVVNLAVQKGAEIHYGRHGTKVVVPDKGSFLVNETKELSKHDRSHFKRIFKLLGLLALAGILVLALTEIIIPLFGYQVVWF